MTDRELLEAAARAAGVCLHPKDQLSHSYGNWGKDTTCMVCMKDPCAASWNPLADDGDALRLAVKLRIDFITYTHTVRAMAFAQGKQEAATSIEEPFGDDDCAATRRAIVRVAAAIFEAGGLENG